MPDGLPVAEAASAWTGAEGVVFGIIGFAAVAALVVIWRHVEKCNAANERLHARISDVKDSVGEMKETLIRVESKVDHMEVKP